MISLTTFAAPGATPSRLPDYASSLTCPMCNTAYLAEDVRLDLQLASCKKCNTVRDLPANASQLAGPAPSGVLPLPPSPRPRAALPSGFSVEERPGCLRISWKTPAGPSVVGLVFWLGLGAWAVLRGTSRLGDPVFLGGFALVALGLAFMVLANLVNVTSVEATADELRIIHGPLPVPWRRSRRLPVSELDQLACCARAWRSGTYFDVCALTRNGDPTTLISGLAEPQQALYLEQQLERRLRITDRPVAGELKRAREPQERPLGSRFPG